MKKEKNHKDKLFIRLIKLFLGLTIFSFGNSWVYQGNIGIDSWNSFHYGISQLTNISIGLVAIIVSVFAFLVAISLGEKFGLGTIVDGLIVGPIFQFFIDHPFINMQKDFLPGLLFVFIGMCFTSIGALLYMSSGFGAGPRDSMYVGLGKKFHIQVGYVKVICEITVVALALLIKSKVGLGTAITALMNGLVLQAFIYISKFDPKKVVHENIIETVTSLKGKSFKCLKS